MRPAYLRNANRYQVRAWIVDAALFVAIGVMFGWLLCEAAT